MKCQRCGDWFIKKLGRCHACMIQTALLFMVSLTFWLYLEGSSSVEAITAMFFVFASGGLFTLHILVWTVRRILGKP
ncbi:DUF3624 family protein [Motilimonas sp. KMU-193]|uniref:DUF3624 family protein n=1 Tax=Motilimonas sp. KMU-193 TaxID=3388668 RepID=UPI00396B2210